MPLPLDQFLLPASGTSKRPHSPGAPTPFSPAKRRLLNDEGLFKTPLPRNTDSSRFATVLASPASPARVLDFGGLPRSNAGDPQKRPAVPQHPSGTLPSHSSSTSSSSSSSHTGLAPSPELKPRGTRPTRITGDEASVNLFDFDTLPSPSASPTSSSFTLVPRDLPPQIDPRSAHYPGFVVYQDPHIVVYNPPTDNGPGPDDMDEDAQVCKENVAPRRRLKKMATEPLPKTNHLSASGTPAKKSYSVQDTPRMPPRSNVDGMRGIRSPSMTPQTAIHKGMLQLMKDELDIGEGSY